MQITSTSLTLRSLLKSAASRMRSGVAPSRVTGLTAAAKALFVAGAAAETRCLLLAPSDADVEQLSSDARFFLSALEGLSDADARRAVLPFPSPEVDPYRGLAPHFEVSSARARALHALATGQARIVIASAAGLLPRVSAPARVISTSMELATGIDISPLDLGALLAEAGYTREDPVDQHGEYCVRGGVVDFFPAGDDFPVRIEFIGDTIESIRRYDPTTQRSIETLDRAGVMPLRDQLDDAIDVGGDRSATLLDYLARGSDWAVFVSEPEEVGARAAKRVEQIQASYQDSLARLPHTLVPEPAAVIATLEHFAPVLDRGVSLEELGLDTSQPGTRHIPCQPAVAFRGRVPDWVEEIRRARARGDRVLFIAATHGRVERTVELLRDYDVVAVDLDRAEESHSATVLVGTGRLSRGFCLPDAAIQVWAETDLFEEEWRTHDRRRAAKGAFLSDFRDLKVGDHVVHVDHGIGVFVGLKQITVGAGGADVQEFMELRYAGEDKLFVPVERLDLVQKYTGGARPTLDRLGGTTWERAKSRVKKAMRDMAEELLKLYASRKSIAGHAFSEDTHWQQEFEDAFEFELTPDQRAAIADIKRDMETPTPMDRLLCGDVGYGKTEVAMRAAFKAVMDGKQVAVLAPTTVLAFQHLKTLRRRFDGFPLVIDMISRFRSKAEQKQTLAELSAGRVDIIVGTHRLLSKDVQFKDLGLLVVDEEQRFGVAHKERIKRLRKRVDVLTMTATPIPRTLNMSLVGIRDMSIIETPPKDRLAIQTSVVKFDAQIIARAIRNELDRAGQVYFVHNRVESIYSVANLITRLVPEARLRIAHGQMGEDDLEKVMVDFVAYECDVLVATTIIENGLDIPNANTLVVNRADRYGLAQLYQLRGRVGRSDRRAYAYLLIPPEEALSPVARKRLAAIREFSDLGSGFRIAALDLEIRGAGNLLGGEQSGHIEAVGFDTYMKLLEDTVRELKGEDLEDERRASVNLRVDLRIEEAFIPDMNQRLAVYRRIAAARDESALETILAELRDRYGALPASVLNLGDYSRIRIMADRLGVESLDREGQTVVLRFRPDARLDAAFLVRLVQARDDLTLVPPTVLKIDLRRSVETPEAPTRTDRPARPSLPLRASPPPPAASRRGPGKRPVSSGVSWWTARATAGEVAPGFDRESILRRPKEDPRGENGLFDRVGSLLAELSEGLIVG
ncbi:MAG TPA: transcription-repair coupling factor [Vicinamibacterales bacterium]|nr:transcription-repair coupling factor [Vicinamibacterales bacterium]